MNHILFLCVIFICQWHIHASLEVIDGEWTEWSYVGTDSCSETCGPGVLTKQRACQNPQPQNGGLECEGNSTKAESCLIEPCWIDGADSEWGLWSSCDKSCGRGSRQRKKVCVTENKCLETLATLHTQNCNTWNKTTCPSPCLDLVCPDEAQCTDISTNLERFYKCECVMGRILSPDEQECIHKPSPTPTPRPIPTLTPEEKQVSVVITKTASTILLIFVGITLGVFCFMRIFTADRIIQMNMEIALFIAHILLLVPYSAVEEHPMICKWISIGLHFFFTSCFAFLFLESLHMYSLVAYVVPKDGIIGKLPNTLIGWSMPGFVIMFSLCFHYNDYGSSYHCWLEWGSIILYAQMVPILLLSLLTLILTEAAGAADFKKLDEYNRSELFSAKISQRANLVLLPLILTSWIIGFLSEYEQNLGLYSTFSVLNAVIGVLVFFFHTTGNEKVREKLKEVFSCCISAVKK